MIYINKKLRLERVNLENIAQKYGTPAYCYSYNQLRNNIIRFKRNFESFSPMICFAVKSNTNLSLLKEIKKFGLGADVVSQGELMIDLPGSNIIFELCFFRNFLIALLYFL